MSFVDLPSRAVPRTILGSTRGSSEAVPDGWFSSLSNRLILWVLAVSYSITLTASATFYVIATQQIESTEFQVLSQRMDTVHDWMDSETLDEPSLYHEVTENNLAPREILMRVIDPRRNILIETPEMDRLVPQSLLPGAANLRLNDRVTGEITNEFGNTFKTLVARLAIGKKEQGHWVVIQAAVNTSIDSDATKWFRYLFAAIAVGGFILCLAVAIYVVRHELGPLKSVTEAARRINSVTLDERLKLNGLPRELHQLADEFNLMLDRLQTTYVGLQQYADNAAHELRGPVNRMLLEGEVALNGRSAAVADYRAALESNTEEARHLARIVDNLLFLARSENATMSIGQSPVDLCKVIAKVADFFEASAEDKAIRLTVACNSFPVIPGDEDLMVRAVSNLIGNAIEHTPRGGEIRMSASVESGKAILTVADTGDGIAEDALPFIFDRFYRADSSRTAGPRIGLGLPITRSIIQLHSGEIHAESSPGKGTTMTVTFAKKP